MKQHQEEIEEGIGWANFVTKQLVVMGDLNNYYLTMTQKKYFDTVFVPCNLLVCNSSRSIRLTAQKSFLIDYIITVSGTKNGEDITFVADTLVKTDHEATLSFFNSKLSTICKPAERKSSAVKTTVARYSVVSVETVSGRILVRRIVPREGFLLLHKL